MPGQGRSGPACPPPINRAGKSWRLGRHSLPAWKTALQNTRTGADNPYTGGLHTETPAPSRSLSQNTPCETAPRHTAHESSSKRWAAGYGASRQCFWSERLSRNPLPIHKRQEDTVSLRKKVPLMFPFSYDSAFDCRLFFALCT